MMLLFRPAIPTLACCIFMSGCTTPPIAREAVVGSYAYVSEDPENRATDHEWDHLTLQVDGTYDLVQGGPTKAKTEKTGLWHFFGGDAVQLLLDHTSYPVQVQRNEVRLLIDNDVGIWYAKAK
jgi:hypothetical protein